MSRNSEYRFGQIPKAKISRSKFFMRKNVKGSFNTGDIIPFYVNQDITAGDTYKIRQKLLIRMATPLYPTIDNLVCDTYFFAVPYRLLWDDFKKFMGENENGAWAQTTEYEVPQLTVPSTANATTGTPKKGTLWDYMGLPIGIKGSVGHDISVSILPFRAYIEIYNYFFRNQNLIAPQGNYKNNTTLNYNESYPRTGGKVLKASKLPSYLTTCLPEPQKGAPVNVPIGTSAPIYGNGKTLGLYDGTDGYMLESNNGTLKAPSSDTYTGSQNVGTDISQEALTYNSGQNLYGLPTKTSGFDSNIYADLSSATAATINALRLAFQTQKILEADARGGTLYPQILLNHFGVVSPDARQQRPEYLGGKRIPIVMNQVAQTSPDANSPLGNTGAFSLSYDNTHLFTKSFTEHTILMGVMVVRQLEHTSQQNIPRQWSRRKRLDFYWPELAHLGEQPVYNKEIYADGSANDEEVFGYQERFAEMKYEENVICGELRSTYATPLDTWHYGDLYNSLPVLSQNWIEETKNNVARTLAVQNHDQFIFDTDLEIEAIRPLPVYCTPGLIDHF